MMNVKEKIKKLHRNNRGFSLVEVIIAMSILSVVSLIVMRFMTTSSSTYARSTADVDLQSEAQLVANTVKELIIDCQVSTKFFPGTNSYSDGTNNYSNALLINNENEQVIIFQGLLPDGTLDDKLYYVSRERNGVTGNFDTPFVDVDDPEILGEYISKFEVDTDTYSDNNTIHFSLAYKLRDREYKGNYQVYMRNEIKIDETTDYEPSNKEEVTQVIVSPPMVTVTPYTTMEKFVAVVRSSGSIPSGVDWALDTVDTGCAIDTATGELTLVSEPTVENFRVVASSQYDPTKAGSATVRVKKVTDIALQAVSGIVDYVDGTQAAAMNSKVLYVATVNGWNLTATDQSVMWKLEYRTSQNGAYEVISEFDSLTQSYKNTRPDVAQISAAGLVTLGANATVNHEFRITATSILPKYGNTLDFESTTSLLRVVNHDVEFDGVFARGLDINLRNYFLSGESQLSSDITEIKYFTDISSADGADININMERLRDGILHVNEESYNYQNQNDFQKYYDEQTLNVLFYDQNDTTQLMEITLPNVEIMKGSPATDYLVVQKGTTTDVAFAFNGINITSAGQIGIYVDDEKVSDDGSSDVNRYVSSYLQTYGSDGGSAFGTTTKYVDKLTARLLINNVDNSYPTEKISYKITIDDFYQKSSGTNARSFIEYDIFVANVQNQNLYVPGPADTDNFPLAGNTNNNIAWATYTVKPMNIQVEMRRQNGRYYIRYGGKTYVYDTDYSYWKQNG